MAKLIEHGLSFTERRPDGSHKVSKRAAVIGAGIGGLATAGALAQYFEQVDILERDRLAATAGSRSGTSQYRCYAQRGRRSSWCCGARPRRSRTSRCGRQRG